MATNIINEIKELWHVPTGSIIFSSGSKYGWLDTFVGKKAIYAGNKYIIGVSDKTVIVTSINKNQKLYEIAFDSYLSDYYRINNIKYIISESLDKVVLWNYDNTGFAKTYDIAFYTYRLSDGLKLSSGKVAGTESQNPYYINSQIDDGKFYTFNNSTYDIEERNIDDFSIKRKISVKQTSYSKSSFFRHNDKVSFIDDSNNNSTRTIVCKNLNDGSTISYKENNAGTYGRSEIIAVNDKYIIYQVDSGRTYGSLPIVYLRVLSIGSVLNLLNSREVTGDEYTGLAKLGMAGIKNDKLFTSSNVYEIKTTKINPPILNHTYTDFFSYGNCITYLSRTGVTANTGIYEGKQSSYIQI